MNIQKIYDSVATFNSLGGSFSSPDKQAPVNLYLSLIFEELTETIDAFEAKDAIELLDGAADIAVVAFGLLQALESAGFNVEEALTRVADNNLSKFAKVVDVQPYNELGYTVEQRGEFSVLKDGNNKIRKPIGFEPVDLTGLTNDEFFGGVE